MLNHASIAEAIGVEGPSIWTGRDIRLKWNRQMHIGYMRSEDRIIMSKRLQDASTISEL